MVKVNKPNMTFVIPNEFAKGSKGIPANPIRKPDGSSSAKTGLVITTDRNGNRSVSTAPKSKFQPQTKTKSTPAAKQSAVPVKQSGLSKTLRIRNLHPSATEPDLHVSLSNFGELERIVLLRKLDKGLGVSVSTGVAEVVYKQASCAQRAKNELDGHLVDGRLLSCSFMDDTPLSFVGQSAVKSLHSNSAFSRKISAMAMDIDDY